MDSHRYGKGNFYPSGRFPGTWQAYVNEQQSENELESVRRINELRPLRPFAFPLMGNFLPLFESRQTTFDVVLSLRQPLFANPFSVVPCIAEPFSIRQLTNGNVRMEVTFLMDFLSVK